MEERPKQRPEGKLIAAALKRSGTSQREAARRADMSENRWRAIMHGYQNVGTGTYVPVRGPADTVARMAQVVGVTPEQLAEAGREDAAEELRTLPPLEEPKTEPTVTELDERVRRLESAKEPTPTEADADAIIAPERELTVEERFERLERLHAEWDAELAEMRREFGLPRRDQDEGDKTG